MSRSRSRWGAFAAVTAATVTGALLAGCPGPAARAPSGPPPEYEEPPAPPWLDAGADAAESAAEPAEADADASGPRSGPLSGRPLHHVLGTGQSLSIGVGGRPALTSSQPGQNLMFATGVMAFRENLDAFVPLVEGDFIPGTQATTETMSSAFANLASALAEERGDAHDVLVSVHGAGAFPYFKLKKGTRPYETGMIQVAAARDLARKLGRPYVVTAVTNVHGESDHAEKTANYAAALREWQADVESDIRALTGQAEPVPMLHTQMSSWTRMMKGTETSAIPQAQLDASVASSGKLVLVGPKYHLPYAKDGVHLSNEGYRHMGEDYAKAYRRVVLEGGAWEPLRPLEITRKGAVLTVRFLVPSPPLVLDTKTVVDPGSYGFEYANDEKRPPAIAKASVTAPDTVTLTLARPPKGGGGVLRYAFTGRAGAPSGPKTGARGNLRDSDRTKSRFGYDLSNWCVHFEVPAP